MARDKRESIIIYGSMLDALAELPPENIAEMVRAIRAYMRGEAFDFSNPILRAWFSDMKSRFDADADKFKEVCNKRSEAGKRGNLVRWGESQKSQMRQTESQKSQCDKKIANVAENENENEKRKKCLKKESPSDFCDSPPKDEAPRNGYTLAEVLDAAKDPSVCVAEADAKAFYDHYNAQAWEFGNGKGIANLHSALRRWKRGKRDGPAFVGTQSGTQSKPNRNEGTYNDPNGRATNDPF